MRPPNLISTDSVSPSSRVCLYEDTVSKLFGQLESKVAKERPFMARFEHASIGDLGICRLTASSHTVERTGSLARRYGAGYLKVALQIRGTAYFSQGGRGLLLSPGEWSVYDTENAYRVLNLSEVEQLLLMLPREKVYSKGYSLDDLSVRRFSGSVGIGKLAYQFIRSVFDEIPALDPQSEPDVIDTIAHLVRLTMIKFSGGQSVGSPRLFLSERIKSYILDHLRDPELSIDQIAAVLKCTKRHLHKVFEAEGVSLSEYIWGLRLDRCRADVMNPECLGRSITEIAFSWGFNTSAHFSTAFKERFGVSPRSYRGGEQLLPGA